MENEHIHTDEECIKLLKYISESPAEIMAKLAPSGWKNSPFVNKNERTALQEYEHKLSIHNAFGELFKKMGQTSEAPILEEIEKEFAANALKDKSLEEFLDLLGDCLWCVFSNNHDVVDQNDCAYHLGSFRGSGGFIADFLNEHHPTDKTFEYMHFYCADMRFKDGEDDALPMFIHIFEKLKKANLDWRYSFPKINIISFDKPEDDVKPEDYDPQKAIQDQLEKEKKEKEVEKLREELDKSYEEAREDAKYKAPPIFVRAYYAVYDRFPVGWVVE